MRIAFASDHAGYEVRNQIVDFLKSTGHEVIDYGSKHPDQPDYTTAGHKQQQSASIFGHFAQGAENDNNSAHSGTIKCQRTKNF